MVNSMPDQSALTPGTLVIYLTGKRRLPGAVYAVGAHHYHLILDNGSEILHAAPGAVQEATREPTDA